ncbi:MAG TPA: glycosyl hydrolase [Terracidiphilus sp.]|nr:glycosyl hydrolase [Terracidiphilus sp.]
MRQLKTALAAFVCLLTVPCLLVPAQSSQAQSPDALLRGFENPPNGARPRVWWHWMNGNISEEGIKLDLDWMHRVGLGGVTIFEGAIRTPQVVPQRLIYMTPDWKKAFDYALTDARSKGMEVAIASSPGWSETGGPWVQSAHGMKKLVWSATRVQGGQAFRGTLPHPPQNDGTFQDFSVPGRMGPDGKISTPPEYYADVAVVAYKIPAGDEPQPALDPRVTASEGNVNVPALSDGDVEKVALDLPAGAAGDESWVQFNYGHPQIIQAVTLACPTDTISVFDHDTGDVPPRLEASDDGVHFRAVAAIPFTSIVQSTASFDAVTARYFRVVFHANADARRPERDFKITELVLHSGARTNEWEKRAGYANARDFYAIPDPSVAAQFTVAPSDVIDLTRKMRSDGGLDWTPPPGEWMILRFGYSLTGHENGPAPAEATGLEVDKLNRADVKDYLDHYLGMYANTVGTGMMGKPGISYLLTDSIEVGPQNWTDDMFSDFQRLRGYNMRLWLPALSGVVIKSTYDTDRFLWDFRRTIGQLLAENHYGEIADDLHAHAMRYYSEALEMHRPSLGDDMEMRSHADVPMGAMWTYPANGNPDPTYLADLRGAASIAHIYGQNLVGAESMTSRGPAWAWSPNSLKRIADLEFALGVNRFEIHESTHQPVPDMAPGLTLGPYGLWFNRNQTWADDAGPWVSYLARCSYLLQQGHYDADVAYFYGEEGPLTAVFGWKKATDLPTGYAFDFVNSDVILHHLSFREGRLVTPGGTSYRILYLGGRSNRMTLPVLRKIADFVSQGAVLVGNKPADSPSLADNESEFHALADKLWGKGSRNNPFIRKYGKGRVYSGISADQALANLKLSEDFSYTKPDPGTKLMFVHRKLGDGDLYFVDNREDRAEDLEATFRVAGFAPELWDPATGTTRAVSYRIAGDRTTVTLHLDPYGSIFVVFRKRTTEASFTAPNPEVTQLPSLDEALNHNWTVTFQPCRGAPAEMPLENLTSWTDNSNYGVKYFSGTATYSKTIEIPVDALRPGAHLWLDLGDVENIARIEVNGKSVGIAWKAPFQVDLTGAVKPGSNSITIAVTNLWVNRLIGDQQPWALRKYAFSDFNPYKADSPLLSSGLLGPLHLVSIVDQ